MKPRSFYFRFDMLRLFLLLIVGLPCAAAQGPPPPTADQTLAQSVQELRQQVEDLRAAVAEDGVRPRRSTWSSWAATQLRGQPPRRKSFAVISLDLSLALVLQRVPGAERR